MAIKELPSEFNFPTRTPGGDKGRTYHNWDKYCDGGGYSGTPEDWGGAEPASMLTLLNRHAAARGRFLLYSMDKKAKTLAWRARFPVSAAEVAYIRKVNASSISCLKKGQEDPTYSTHYPWMDEVPSNGDAHTEVPEGEENFADEVQAEETPEPEPVATGVLPTHLQGKGKGRKNNH